MADLHRIIADALLEADGYDPAFERDPEGSGPGDCVKVAEARADRIVEAVEDAIGDSIVPLDVLRRIVADIEAADA